MVLHHGKFGNRKLSIYEKNILVTGATGLLGNHFTDHLSKNNCNFKALALDDEYVPSYKNLYPEIDLSQAVPKEKPMLETASAEPKQRPQLASDIVEAAAVPAESGGISDLVSQVGSSLDFDRGSPRSTLAPSALSEQEDARFNLLLQNLTGK